MASNADNGRKPGSQEGGCLQRFSHAIESRMTGFFSSLGRLVANRPYLTLLSSIIVVIIGTSGISVLEEEARGDKLWLPTDTRAQNDWETYLSYFPREGRENLIIAVPTDGDNILTKDNLQLAMDLFDKVKEFDITYEGEVYKLEDICVKSTEFTGIGCNVESILEKWSYDSSQLIDDNDVVATVNEGSTVKELESLLGNLGLSEDESEVETAEALRIFILLENTERVVDGDYSDPIPEAWEEVYIDTVLDCVDGLECFVEAERSLSDEFGEAIQGDISLITGSYLIIMVYTIINLSGRPLLRSRIMLSLGAVLTVGLSIAFSIGLASYLGFFYTPLHTVLPFVLLGLGVDDSFVICNSFGRTDPRESIPDRMAAGLGHSGVSITVTSITDFVAFMISSSTVLPALSSFCVYAAFGILALYVLQSTMFTAFVVLDARRQAKGKLDVCCCCSTSNPNLIPATATRNEIGDREWEQEMAQKGFLPHFVSRVYAPLLKNKLVKALVLMAYFGMLAIFSYGASKLDVSDTSEAFIPDGSYILDTNDAVDEYFGSVGVDVEIVTEDIDYFGRQNEIADIAERLSGFGDSKSPYIQDPETSGTFFSWYDGLIEYAVANGTKNLDENDAFVDETEFFMTLDEFLSSDEGTQYNASVVIERDELGKLSGIRAASIQAEYSGSINGEAMKQVDAMVDLRDILDGWDFDAFPWTQDYLQWETFRIIYEELFQGLGLCLLAVLVLTLILIAHPGTALLVFLCVLMTIVDVLGVMYFWDLTIDTVAVINLVLAVGLSVDYSAHVGHTFMIKSGSKDDRMVQALSDIGVAVIHGGVSTFLAVVLLSASSSYVFRVLFKQFFSTAVLGLGHGLMLLPVLLSLFGPAPYSSAGKKTQSTAAVSGTYAHAGVAVPVVEGSATK